MMYIDFMADLDLSILSLLKLIIKIVLLMFLLTSTFFTQYFYIKTSNSINLLIIFTGIYIIYLSTNWKKYETILIQVKNIKLFTNIFLNMFYIKIIEI